jgi:hypothetical protein
MLRSSVHPYRNRPALAVLVCIALVMNTSCTTRRVVVPQTDYESETATPATLYRITTSNHKTYMVEAFTTTETTLTIHRLQGKGNGAVYDGDPYPNVELPLVLELSQVISVERIEPRPAGMFAVKTVMVVVVTAIVAAIVIGTSLHGGFPD